MTITGRKDKRGKKAFITGQDGSYPAGILFFRHTRRITCSAVLVSTAPTDLFCRQDKPEEPNITGKAGRYPKSPITTAPMIITDAPVSRPRSCCSWSSRPPKSTEKKIDRRLTVIT
jgi:hypothetical protein